MENMIPKVKSYNRSGNGSISLKDISIITGNEQSTQLYNDYITSKFISNKGSNKTIDFASDDSISSEGYKIDISDRGIRVLYSGLNGLLYALQTLRILAEVDVKGSKCDVQCGVISDEPKHAWRAIMLDVSRYFHGVDTVKRLLDMMVLHKLNVFHWHLTDDAGWRIEIKKYPLLVEKGSHRPKSHIKGWGSIEVEEIPHSGYYTQEDIKDVVAYATARGITVVPEIDMPCHFMAAFAGYPELACRELVTEPIWFFGGKFAKKNGIIDWYRSACIGKPKTFEFIFDVLAEVFTLFPSPYFHIGGDEAEKVEWGKCPHCAKYMSENNIADTHALQCHFINEINKFCIANGKTLIGWNEVLEGGKLDNKTLVQYWTINTDKAVITHMEKGGKIILSKHKPMYLDMSYAQYSLKDMYEFTEHIAGINASHDSNIVGVEAPLWTEFVSTREKLDMQLFPRLEAFAEVGWGSKREDFNEFKSRLENFKRILDVYDVWYAEPRIAVRKNPITRLKIRAIWYTGNTELEFEENKILRAKRLAKRNKK